jgi:hypothetical protein
LRLHPRVSSQVRCIELRFPASDIGLDTPEDLDNREITLAHLQAILPYVSDLHFFDDDTGGLIWSSMARLSQWSLSSVELVHCNFGSAGAFIQFLNADHQLTHLSLKCVSIPANSSDNPVLPRLRLQTLDLCMERRDFEALSDMIAKCAEPVSVASLSVNLLASGRVKAAGRTIGSLGSQLRNLSILA